mmetsp:Transcript_804/g.1022  ORF Transcript_804/g.1022 Transcript_804/m.1022 type:complete len:86 (-) Transcript_804:2632-2889(-)
MPFQQQRYRQAHFEKGGKDLAVVSNKEVNTSSLGITGHTPLSIDFMKGPKVLKLETLQNQHNTPMSSVADDKRSKKSSLPFGMKA